MARRLSINCVRELVFLQPNNDPHVTNNDTIIVKQVNVATKDAPLNDN